MWQGKENFDYNGDEMVYVKRTEVCCVCGNHTHFVSISFQVPLCCPRCADSLWDEYLEALR